MSGVWKADTDSKRKRTYFERIAERDTAKTRVVQSVGAGKIAEVNISVDPHYRLFSGRLAEITVHGP